MTPTLRKGFTTGTAAAAAAEAAAILAATGSLPDEVNITLPGGLRTIAIKTQPASLRHIDCTYAASVIKDGGDDPDATSGLEIIAAVRLLNPQGGDVFIKGGDGVGVVTKAGLQCPVGAAAINPVPQKMILTALRKIIPDGTVEVEIIVPDGKQAALRTFNGRLGIIGGISIIGTTGIVEPMSVEAIKATIACELDVAFEENSSKVYLSPGKIGEDSLKAIFAGIRVVQMSNFIGDALSYAATKGFRHIIIGGHPGKLAKLLMGYFNTHSGNSPQATGFVAKLFGLKGEYNTVEEIISQSQNSAKFDLLAYEIAAKIRTLYGFSAVDVLLFNMNKQRIGASACTR